MLLNERESKYSQPKLELYGLFRSLRAARLWIIGVKNLIVEVDAKYIKGMLNNPDIQPNATINHWIAGILLFDFTLVHVPGATHAADSLSRRPAQPDDEPEAEEDTEDWIDRAYGFLHLINPTSLISGQHHLLSMITLSDTPLCSTTQTTNLPPTQYFKFTPPRFATLLDEIPVQLDFTPTPASEDAVFIPRTPEADKADLRLNSIVAFLDSLKRPPDLIDIEFKCFIKYAMQFFTKSGTLWHKDPQQKHKIVAAPNR